MHGFRFFLLERGNNLIMLSTIPLGGVCIYVPHNVLSLGPQCPSKSYEYYYNYS